MVNFAAEDEWQSHDETGYENPFGYDPHVVDENDPTVDGDDPALDDVETDEDERRGRRARGRGRVRRRRQRRQ